MNKGRLIGGILCLVVAAMLMVLIFTLPEGKVVFMVGDSNVPWIPVIVLAGLGAGLMGVGDAGEPGVAAQGHAKGLTVTARVIPQGVPRGHSCQ